MAALNYKEGSTSEHYTKLRYTDVVKLKTIVYI